MKSISIPGISISETTQIKAYAILLIMFHNFYRWITPTPWENEFDFSQNKVVGFIKMIANQPLEIGNLLFSFWGHYGVQVFIILSTYGLFKSYQNKSIIWFDFMKTRYSKLYPSFVFAVITYIFYLLFLDGNYLSIDILKDLLWQLSTIGNFIPNKATIINGPWWFYSLIFQVYAIVPLLFYAYKKYGVRSLLFIGLFGYIITLSSYSFIASFQLNILYTVFGHLPEVILGIWLASEKTIKIPVWIFPVSLIIFGLGNYYYHIWFFSHLTAGILILFGILWFIRKTSEKQLITKTSLFIGNISIYLFAIHGFLRWKLVGRANYHLNPLGSFLFGILFIIISVILAYVLTKFEYEYRQYIKRAKNKTNRYIRIVVPLFLIIIFYAALKYENRSYPKWLPKAENGIKKLQ